MCLNLIELVHIGEGTVEQAQPTIIAFYQPTLSYVGRGRSGKTG